MIYPDLAKSSSGRRPPRAPARRLAVRSPGFSLVELMVAVVIGMLGIIIMMQVFSVFEAQKRTTISGDDAISAGSLALYGIQRMVEQSGWGFSAPSLIGCTVSGIGAAGSPDLPLVPVTINPPLTVIPAGDAGSDRLLVMAGTGGGAVEGERITSAAGNAYTVLASLSFALGDRVVAVPRARTDPCGLALGSVSHMASGVITVDTAAAFVPAADDLLFNLGATPIVSAYAIRAGRLTVCDYVLNNCADDSDTGDETIWVPIADNVVSLRAQYGRDTTDAAAPPPTLTRMDGAVDVWDQDSWWAAATWTSGSVSTEAGRDTRVCALLRTGALRIALVARSSQPEKIRPDGSRATAPARTWTNLLWMGADAASYAANATTATAVAIALPDPDTTWPTWRDFRYKVFQTVVPIRNVTIQGVLSQC